METVVSMTEMSKLSPMLLLLNMDDSVTFWKTS